MSEVAAIVSYLRSRVTIQPEVAIVCGSGLSGLANLVEDAVTIEYTDIPHFPRSTVEGHGNVLVFGTLEGKKVVVMKGRFHFYEVRPSFAEARPDATPGASHNPIALTTTRGTRTAGLQADGRLHRRARLCGAGREGAPRDERRRRRERWCVRLRSPRREAAVSFTVGCCRCGHLSSAHGSHRRVVVVMESTCDGHCSRAS